MTYKRDAAKIHQALKETDVDSCVALKPLQIHIPVRFADCGLATVGQEITTYGAFVILDEEGNYGVVNICGMFRLSPSRSTKTIIEDKEYFVFYFEKGDTVFVNLNIIKTAKFLFKAINEFQFRADIPWYFDYEDRGKIFDTADEFAGSKVGESLEMIELFTAITARDPKDLTKFYRTLSNNPNNPPPSNVGMKSVQYSATNTTNKLSGAYFSDGVVSALVVKTEKTEKMEELLRT